MEAIFDLAEMFRLLCPQTMEKGGNICKILKEM